VQPRRHQLGQHVYPVPRLDRPTSGVLLFALDTEAARLLTQQFENKTIEKTYWAIVRGHLPSDGLIDYALKYMPDKIAEAQTEATLQEAQTAYRCLAQTELPFQSALRYPTSRYSWAELTPHTGRKHQLRRHMKHIFHPIIGDNVVIYSNATVLGRITIGSDCVIGANTWVQDDMRPKTKKYKKIKKDSLDIQYNNGTGI